MPELISKTSAVAVTASLATLLDWTSIEGLSGFTIIVTNAGGGSAQDLTDIQIDTSTDGGTTILLDQHAGVPAVPIPSGESRQAAFTETASHIRVRGLCGTGDDTTATLVLLAATVSPRLCTLADVKDRLGLSSGTEYDTLINRIIAGLTAVFEREVRRPLLLTAADSTEYYTGDGPFLQVDRYPVAALTSIKVATDYVFTSAEALVADTDYRLLRSGEKGILHRLYMDWEDQPDCIQIVYRGGYCSAGVTPGTGETALPADLREAAILQSAFLFKRKDDIGLSSVSYDGGSISKFSALDLLPLVKDILGNYRKLTL